MSSIDDPLPCAKKSQLCTQTKKMAMDTVFRDALDGFESTPHSETFKMLELEVNSQEKLEICVNLTLTKALEEPAKHATLAQLCKKIGSHKVEWVEKDTVKETTFKKELLLRCQSELDRVKKDEDEAFRMSEAIEAADSSEEKSQLEAEHQEFMSRARERALCLFSFCGELFAVEMFPENIMHECLVSLLRSTSDDAYLECFCRLITITGKCLDHSKAKVRIDSYFERIAYILKERRISLEVKLMLQEVQELRKNKWTKRQLNKAKQPWVRPQLALADASKEQRETAILFGKFQAILNKLTPQRFQRLAEQALLLEINTEERLKGCVDLIFARVIRPTEHIYGVAYANLCKVMSPLKVEWEEEGRMRHTNFRRELLTKLQAEFERDKKDDEKRDALGRAVTNAFTPEERKQLEDELEEFTIKARERSLSNILFIGELFKLAMLSETILHECIVRLLKSTSDEESLECFAKLITVAGKELDSPKAKNRIDGYFIRMADIIKKGRISTRMKFILQDVQDLRKNDWVPRRHQAPTVKTIDQIHAEAKKAKEEDLRMAGVRQAASNLRQSRPKPKMDRNRLAALKKDKKEARVKSSVSASAPVAVRKSTTGGASLKEEKNDDLEMASSCDQGVIQRMVRSITEDCVTSHGSTMILKEEIFHERCLELKKYVPSGSISLQVQVLYELQVGATKLEYQPRLLNQMFNQLYSIGVIEEEAFKQWRDEGTESEGKDYCIQATKPFFDWLYSDW